MPEAVTLRERLRARAVLGTFVQTPHPVTAEFLSGFGLDFLCIDAEHAAMGVETVQALVAAAAPVAALVRVAENSAAHVGAALDSGAAGVLVPPGELGRRNGRRRAVRAVPAPRRARCRSRPRRRLRPLAGRVPRMRNEQLVVAVQVETRAALDRLDEILAVAGVDVAFFFGPGDLALSLGVPLGGEEVYEAVESGFARAPSRRVAPLAPTRTAPSTRRTGSRVARTCSPSAPTSRSSPPGSSRLAVGSRS